MEREKSDVGPREFLRRTMRAVATFFMTAVIGSLPAAAAIPAHKPNTPAKSRRAAAVKVLSALKIDPYGKMDPLDQFETWRRQNRVSLPVTPPIWQAHLTWVNYRKQRTRLKKGTVSGAQFNARSSRKAPILPTASVGTNMPLAGGVQGYQGEVTIAVNPNNSNQLVAGANTFYQDPAAACQAPSGTTYGTQALYGSNDGGASWTYNCAPWPSNDTGGVGSTYFGSDPTVAWDANGNAYATYMLISQSSGGSSSSSIVIAKSTDAGATWNPLGIVINDLNNSSSFDDKEMMAIDTTSGQAHSHTNRIYVIWDQNNVERVAYSDNGTSWTTVVVETGGNSDIGGDLAVAPDGTVYAIWDRLPSTGDTHVFAKSTDGGATWSTPVQIAAGNLTSFSNNDPPAQNSRGINAFGSIAVDRDPGSPYYGTIYVVYPDFPSGGTVNGTNIYLTKSADGGSTWSTPLKVNDDSATHTQFFPWVTVDQSSGAVYASWYDTRNDSSLKKTQIYLAQSTDGGASFSTNVQVSQASSSFTNGSVDYSDENSTDNGNYNGNQYGDYSQIAAAKGTVWPIWTDSRQFYPSSGNADVEDAATAAVSFCTTPGTPSGLAAGVPGNNEINLSWTAGSPAGSTYNVYRAVGSCPGSGYALLAGGVTSTTYKDLTVSGGTTYSYEVTAVDNTGGCESAKSACASAAATGACTLPPTFAGLSSVSSPGNTSCELDLSWPAATANCGKSVYYNVYRSTSASFNPSASNRVATGITATSYADTNNLASGTTYYYMVRAVDTSNSSEDSNSTEKSGLPTGTTTTMIDENFEEAGHQPTSGGSWTHSAGQGTDNWVQSTSGDPHSPTHTFFAADVATVNDDYLVTPSFTVPANATLSFWQTYALESTYDGAVIEISTDGGSTWNDLGSDITQGGYNSTISSNWGSPIAGRQAWSGGSIGTETQVMVDLSSFSGQAAQIRFRLACDSSNGDTGWYIDDVVLSGYVSCATVTGVRPVPDGKWISGTPMKATRSDSGGRTIGLTWDVSTCQDPNYNVYYGNGSAVSTYTLTGSACGIGNSGTAAWNNVPSIPSGEKFIWWVLTGTDGVNTESSWGKDSAGNQRHPAASGQCGFTAKSTDTTCP